MKVFKFPYQSGTIYGDDGTQLVIRNSLISVEADSEAAVSLARTAQNGVCRLLSDEEVAAIKEVAEPKRVAETTTVVGMAGSNKAPGIAGASNSTIAVGSAPAAGVTAAVVANKK